MDTPAAVYAELKVLIVDDDEDARRITWRMLRRLGITKISLAADGALGFREVLEFKPDIVLCDIHMTPVDGQEFLKRVRESLTEWVQSLPVIFVSGDTLQPTVELAKQRHVDGFLVKPVASVDLKKHLDIVLARRGRG